MKIYNFLSVFFVLSIGIIIALPEWSSANSSEDRPDITSLSIEDLMEIPVYSASKHKQQIKDAPSSVTVITADEIKKYGYRTLADLLKSVRGFYVTYDRIYSYAGIRGFGRPGDYNTRILVLLDGHRINDNIYNQGFIGTEFILDTDLIERVEIVRGPSSSLYGTSAFFGIINVITKSGKDYGNAEISAEALKFDTFKSRITLGKKVGNLDAIISGTGSNSRGPDLYFKEFDVSPMADGRSLGTDFDYNRSVFSKLSLGEFILQTAYSTRDKGLPTAPFGTIFNEKGNWMRDERGYVELRYDTENAGCWAFSGRIYYDYHKYQGNLINKDTLILNKDFGTGEWWGTEWKITSTGLKNHKTTLGTEYQFDVRLEQENYDEYPPNVYLHDKQKASVRALYLQDEYTLSEEIILNLGIRYDHFSSFGGTINPRAAIIIAPGRDTSIKLLYGKAFKAPSVYELYYNDGGITSKPNTALKPENIYTSELIVEQRVGEYAAAVSLYANTINRLISLETDPDDGLLYYKNADKAKAAGIETEIGRRWKDGTAARLSYTYQSAKDSNTGKMLTNSPKHIGKANMMIPIIIEKVFGGFEIQYIGGRMASSGQIADGYVTSNATIHVRKIARNLEGSFSVYNIFDKKFGDPVSDEHPVSVVNQDGRNFRLKISYAFF